MKSIIILLLLISSTLFGQNTKEYIKQLKQHRLELDKEFGDTATSILPNKMAINFDNLNYYQPNPEFNITARFKKEIGKEFTMTTSSGKKKAFRQYGVLSFKIGYKSFKLPIYQNLKLMKTEKYKDYIFIPFTDLTNNEDTYGGGRYIEATIPQGDTFQLDFNYAFNPYCHYTEGYNCPIPPQENFLDIKIEAGEKVFDNEEH